MLLNRFECEDKASGRPSFVDFVNHNDLATPRCWTGANLWRGMTGTLLACDGLSNESPRGEDQSVKKTLAISAAIVLPLFGLMTWQILGSDDADGSIPLLFFFVFMFLWFALPITALVDAARVPSDKWQQAGLDRTTWVVLIIVGSVVGAIAYFGWIRRRLATAR